MVKIIALQFIAVGCLTYYYLTLSVTVTCMHACIRVRTDLGTDTEPLPINCRLDRRRSVFVDWPPIQQ